MSDRLLFNPLRGGWQMWTWIVFFGLVVPWAVNVYVPDFFEARKLAAQDARWRKEMDDQKAYFWQGMAAIAAKSQVVILPSKLCALPKETFLVSDGLYNVPHLWKFVSCIPGSDQWYVRMHRDDYRRAISQEANLLTQGDARIFEPSDPDYRWIQQMWNADAFR